MKKIQQNRKSVSETLPCPFCGGCDIRFHNHGKVSRALGHQHDDVWSTCCFTCGATFPNRYRRELLVEQWNRRPKSAQYNDLVLVELAELKEYKARMEWLESATDFQRNMVFANGVFKTLSEAIDAVMKGDK